MKLLLSILSDLSEEDKSIELEHSEKFIIGRGESNLTFENDATLSRQHFCLLLGDGNKVFGENLSQNGSSINGLKFKDGEIFEGDVLNIGSITIKFKEIDTSEEKTVRKFMTPTPTPPSNEPEEVLNKTQVFEIPKKPAPQDYLEAEIPHRPSLPPKPATPSGKEELLEVEVSKEQPIKGAPDPSEEDRLNSAWQHFSMLSNFQQKKAYLLVLYSIVAWAGIAFSLKVFSSLAWINVPVACLFSFAIAALLISAWSLVANPFLKKMQLLQISATSIVLRGGKLPSPKHSAFQSAENQIMARCGEISNLIQAEAAQFNIVSTFNSALFAHSTAIAFLKKHSSLLKPFLFGGSAYLSDGLSILELQPRTQNYWSSTIELIVIYCQKHRELMNHAIKLAIFDYCLTVFIALITFVPVELLGLLGNSNQASNKYIFFSACVCFAFVLRSALIKPFLQILVAQKLIKTFAGERADPQWIDDLKKLSPDFVLLHKNSLESSLETGIDSDVA